MFSRACFTKFGTQRTQHIFVFPEVHFGDISGFWLCSSLLFEFSVQIGPTDQVSRLFKVDRSLHLGCAIDTFET